MSNFGRRAELARKALGITRATLSGRLNISSSSLRDLEVVNSTPNRLQELLPRLARELRQPISYLVSGEVSKPAAFIGEEVSRIEGACDRIRRQLD